MSIKNENLDRKTIQYYEREALKYDFSRFSSSYGRLTSLIQKQLIRKMSEIEKEDAQGKLVLDIGTGTGRFSVDFANYGVNIIGFDPSDEMLKIVKRHNRRNISLVRGVGEFLPFRNQSIELVISINVFSHLIHYTKVLDEICRIIKPGGNLIVNIPNITSVAFPIALLVNLRRKALFENVYSRWYFMQSFYNQLSRRGFQIVSIKGQGLSLPIPYIINIHRKIERLAETTKLKYISRTLFIKCERKKSCFVDCP